MENKRMKKKTKSEKNKFNDDFNQFKNSLMFEDAGTVLMKSYKWLRERGDVIRFNIDVNVEKSEVNTLIYFSEKDYIAVTLFEK
jgi:hypothetical protein